MADYMFNAQELTENLTTIFILGFLGFAISMLLTPIFTHYAFKYKLWKRSRTTSATGDALTVISSMRIKRTLPRMSGLISLVAIASITLLFNLDRHQTWLPLAALLGGGLVGMIDDLINIFGKGSGVAGLRPRTKLAMISAVGLVGALFFYFKLDYTTILLPGVGDVELGWLLIPLFVFAVVATSNAVNISDGMDGLAGGMLMSAFSAFGVIALLQGNFGIAGFCMTVAGSLLAYVWFNIPPARFLMGDTGSFAFGSALGVVAMLTDTLFLLPIIALVFVAEAGSSFLQIMSKRIFKRRIFIAAPVHHHFEAQGWPKTKVTMRFWVAAQVCAVLGVVLALLGGYIR